MYILSLFLSGISIITLLAHRLRRAAGTTILPLLAGSLASVCSFAGSDYYYQSADPTGLVVVEAESFDNYRPSVNTDANWTPDSYWSASGSNLLRALPNQGEVFNTDYVQNAPRADYNIYFAHTGKHYIWVRGWAASRKDDTVNIGLNNGVSVAPGLGGFRSSSWGWYNTRYSGPVAVIDVPSTGPHTLNLWVREDGAAVDKIVVARKASYVPEGMGPPASSRQAPVDPDPVDPDPVDPDPVDPDPVDPDPVDPDPVDPDPVDPDPVDPDPVDPDPVDPDPVDPDPVNPDPVPTTITISWERPSSRANGNTLFLSDIDGYELAYGVNNLSTVRFVPGGNVTSALLDDVIIGENYQLVVRTVDSNGVRSADSNLLRFTPD